MCNRNDGNTRILGLYAKCFVKVSASRNAGHFWNKDASPTNTTSSCTTQVKHDISLNGCSPEPTTGSNTVLTGNQPTA